jgi:hypothetical protein
VHLFKIQTAVTSSHPIIVPCTLMMSNSDVPPDLYSSHLNCHNETVIYTCSFIKFISLNPLLHDAGTVGRKPATDITFLRNINC